MFGIPNYDRWKLDDGIGVEKVVCQCDQCDSDIYEGQEGYVSDSGRFCDRDCAIEFLLDQDNGREEVIAND
jgi:hypothetical protein